MKETKSDKIFVAVNYTFLILALLSIAYPLFYITIASVSNPYEVNSGNVWLWPKGFTMEGFSRVFDNPDIWTGYRNTVIYTVLGVAVNLLVTLPCAYAISRRNMPGRNAITFFIVFTMFFMGGLIPTYLLVKSLGLLNTVGAMIFPTAVNVLNLIVSRTFFQSSIPVELEEAAEIDGSSVLRTFISVVIPLSKPIIAVMALFYGVTHWNSYFNALIYISDRELYPLQLFLREILIQNQMGADMIMQESDVEAMQARARIAQIIKYAVMIVSALPLIIVYPFLQKYFVKGVLIGSLKG